MSNDIREWTPQDMIELQHAVLIYQTADGRIVATYLDQANACVEAGLIHVATVNPRMWIQAHWSKVENFLASSAVMEANNVKDH